MYDMANAGPDTTRRFYLCGRCLKYQTLKKTHLERHIDSRTCKMRQLSLANSKTGPANGLGAASDAPAPESPVADTKPLLSAALVRKSIIPVSRPVGAPPAASGSGAGSGRRARAVEQLQWQPRVWSSANANADVDEEDEERSQSPVEASASASGPGGVRRLPSAGQFRMRAVSASNPSPPIVIQIGNTPIIIHTGVPVPPLRSTLHEPHQLASLLFSPLLTALLTALLSALLSASRFSCVCLCFSLGASSPFWSLETRA